MCNPERFGGARFSIQVNGEGVRVSFDHKLGSIFGRWIGIWISALIYNCDCRVDSADFEVDLGADKGLDFKNNGTVGPTGSEIGRLHT